MSSTSQQQSIYVHKAKAMQQQLTPLKGEPLIFDLRPSLVPSGRLAQSKLCPGAE